jgi:hypothetical protein
MRKMKNELNGQILKIKGHIILKNFWEYYVIDQDNNPDNSDIVTCLVLGFEEEIGDVSLSEIKPYVLTKTKDLTSVMPAPNYSWVE